MRTPWTAEDDRTLGEHFPSEDYARLGDRLGRTASSVRCRARKLGLGRYHWVSPAVRDRIRSLSSSGLSDWEVGRAVGRSHTAVRGVRAGLTRSVPTVRHSPLRPRLLSLLDREPRTVLELSGLVGVGCNALRKRLCAMRDSGEAFSQGVYGPDGCRWHSLGWWFSKNQGLLRAKAAEIRRRKPHVEFEEVLNQLHLEVGKSVRSFRPRGVTFGAYAVRTAVLSTLTWCTLELSKGVRFPSQLRSRSVGLVRTSTVDFSNPEAETGQAFVPEPADRDHAGAPPVDPRFWEDAVRGLSPREALVVLGHYRDGRRYTDLGEELGVSRQRVEQLIRGAEAVIRENGNVEEYAARNTSSSTRAGSARTSPPSGWWPGNPCPT